MTVSGRLQAFWARSNLQVPGDANSAPPGPLLLGGLHPPGWGRITSFGDLASGGKVTAAPFSRLPTRWVLCPAVCLRHAFRSPGLPHELLLYSSWTVTLKTRGWRSRQLVELESDPNLAGPKPGARSSRGSLRTLQGKLASLRHWARGL